MMKTAMKRYLASFCSRREGRLTAQAASNFASMANDSFPPNMTSLKHVLVSLLQPQIVPVNHDL